MKKSYLKIIAFMNAYTDGKSGGDMAFIEIFKRITNVDLTVVTSKMGKELCEKRGLRATFICSTSENNFNSIIATYIKRIISAVFITYKLSDFDIVYATSDALPDTLPAFLLKIRMKKIKWVQKIFHIIPSHRVISHYSQEFSFTLIKRFADCTVIDNSLLKKDLQKKGFTKKDILINPLGIDYNWFQNVKPSKNTYDGVFMGRLHRSKGIFDLVIIWRKVIENFPKAKLAIIGRGKPEILKALNKKVQESGLKKNIDLLGHLDDDIAFSTIKSSKVFVFPSHEEGFGLVIAEALACRTPVIAYDLPAYHDTFSDIITVPFGNLKKFSESVVNIIGIKSKRKKVMENGLKLVKNLGWDKTAQRELEFLK